MIRTGARIFCGMSMEAYYALLAGQSRAYRDNYIRSARRRMEEKLSGYLTMADINVKLARGAHRDMQRFLARSKENRTCPQLL